MSSICSGVLPSPQTGQVGSCGRLNSRNFMAWEQSPEVIDWQKRLKRLWDPKNLLNPGKIFFDG